MVNKNDEIIFPIFYFYENSFSNFKKKVHLESVEDAFILHPTNYVNCNLENNC